MKKISLFICVVILYSCHFKRDTRDQSIISSLPAFNMVLMDSMTLLNAGNIQPGSPILIVYFRPDCPHCQAETESFVKNIEVMKKFRIYFLTSASFEDTRGYLHHYHLDKYSNITVGKDYEHSFFKAFKPSSIPYLAVYDGQKRLMKVYYGETPITALVNAVQS